MKVKRNSAAKKVVMAGEYEWIVVAAESSK
jgi:hypothetical protein